MGKKPTILIADKEKILVDLLTRSLSSPQLSVLGTTTAEEAARLYERYEPDLLVIDPTIPNGFALIQSIQGHFKDARIVGLASSDESRDQLTRMAVEINVDRGAGLDALTDAIRRALKSEVPILERDGGVRILVTDDEEEIRTMLSEYLKSRGYVVSTASNGRGAVERATAERNLQIVLLDVNMPQMGGIEALKEIMALDPHPSVIMMTAVADREIARQALKVGAFDYILKPFDLATIDASIAACLSYSEYQKQPWWKRLTSR
jgi:DNA-binding response OmpR family regulator